MGESAISESKTIVLVGRTGNGKSATGNSIIAADVFDSMPSSTSVTATCQLHKTLMDNDQILNVIDTPGLFDTRVEPEIIQKEITKCIKMTKNGIHAVLLVLSIKCRFSQEEASVIEMLKQCFGSKIGDYMIVVFTHGDALRKMSLADYLGRDCPEPLRNILEMCGNRYVLFDNVTEDELKRSKQRKELLCLVDTVVLNNGGIRYSNELFLDSPDICECGVKISKAYEELLLGKFESKLRETTLRMEKQLADEQAGRKKAEALAQEAQLKSVAEINRLKEGFQGEVEMLRKFWIESEQKLENFCVEQRRLQSESSEISEEVLKFIEAHEDQLRDMESKHREMALRLEKLLEVEQAARMQAEAAQMKSNDEISKLREDLERARKTHTETTELLTKRIQENNENQKRNNCTISEITSAIEHKIESKLRETILRLEYQLTDKFALKQAEDKAQEAQIKSKNDEIRKLMEDMERAQTHTENAFEKIQLKITSAMEHLVESKLREATLRLDNQLAHKFAQMQAEDKLQSDDLRKLIEDMERRQRYTEDAFMKIQFRMGEENQERSNSVSVVTSTMEHQFESNVRERILRFGKLLADEKVARLLAEHRMQEVEKKSNNEISKLREDLERAQRDAVEPRKNMSMGDEIDSKLEERILELEKMLADEQIARIQAKAEIEEVEKKASDEISKLREDLERAQRNPRRYR